MLCAKFGRILTSGPGEEDFYILSMYFRFFIIISPWKKTGPLIWTNLNPPHPKMLCATFSGNWLSGSGEEVENVKSLQTDGQTDRLADDGRQLIRKAHLSFQLRWAIKIPIAKALGIQNLNAGRWVSTKKTGVLYQKKRLFPMYGYTFTIFSFGLHTLVLSQIIQTWSDIWPAKWK